MIDFEVLFEHLLVRLPITSKLSTPLFSMSIFHYAPTLPLTTPLVPSIATLSGSFLSLVVWLKKAIVCIIWAFMCSPQREVDKKVGNKKKQRTQVEQLNRKLHLSGLLQNITKSCRDGSDCRVWPGGRGWGFGKGGIEANLKAAIHLQHSISLCLSQKKKKKTTFHTWSLSRMGL